MKVGDLVRKKYGSKHHSGMLGLVLEVLSKSEYARVAWLSDYGTFLTAIDRLEVISERR